MGTINSNAEEAWEGFNTGRYKKGDRIERIGICGFKGRVQKIRGPVDGKYHLEVVTLLERGESDLGIVAIELSSKRVCSHLQRYIPKDGIFYSTLRDYIEEAA